MDREEERRIEMRGEGQNLEEEEVLAPGTRMKTAIAISDALSR